jgi:hypothetical protein
MPYQGKITMQLSSSVDNAWLESSITMVNEQTLEALPVVLSNEFYHGTEDGERWTEGDTYVSKDYSSIPTGRYHLLLETSTSQVAGEYQVKITAGGVYWVNLLVLSILLLIFPLIKYIQVHSFEAKRWADSDFSPYRTPES